LKSYPSTFVVDSGVDYHLTNNYNDFTNGSIKRLAYPLLVTSMGSDLQSNFVGSVTRTIGGKVITLNQVFFVEGLCTSLVSVKQLNSLGFGVVFNEGSCTLWLKGGVFAALSKHPRLDLYTLEPEEGDNLDLLKKNSGFDFYVLMAGIASSSKRQAEVFFIVLFRLMTRLLQNPLLNAKNIVPMFMSLLTRRTLSKKLAKKCLLLTILISKPS
jgi:hypothetical protein